MYLDTGGTTIYLVSAQSHILTNRRLFQTTAQGYLDTHFVFIISTTVRDLEKQESRKGIRTESRAG